MFTNDHNSQDYIEQLQNDRRLRHLCSFILVGCAIVVGVVGNVLALTIYTKRYRRTPTRCLVSIIAGVDLFTNTIAMPLQIYTMYEQWGFSDVISDVFCRTSWVAGSFSMGMSALLLVFVAVVRYRKVCKPIQFNSSFIQ